MINGCALRFIFSKLPKVKTASWDHRHQLLVTEHLDLWCGLQRSGLSVKLETISLSLCSWSRPSETSVLPWFCSFFSCMNLTVCVSKLHKDETFIGQNQLQCFMSDSFFPAWVFASCMSVYCSPRRRLTLGYSQGGAAADLLLPWFLP